jgi:hypothetical protein
MNLKDRRAICILGVLLTTLWYVSAADAQDFVTDGLVAIYTLNEADLDGKVVKDALGKNDAELVGKLKFVEGATDGTGEAMEFEGKPDNYVEIPDMGDFEFVSIECYALEGQFGPTQGLVSTWLWEAGKVHFKFEGNQIQVHKNDGVKIRLAAETDTHNGRFLIGMIDNVRIYDRILDEKEVQQNFESKSDQLPVEPAGKLSATWGYLKALRN